MVKKIIMDV